MLVLLEYGRGAGPGAAEFPGAISYFKKEQATEHFPALVEVIRGDRWAWHRGKLDNIDEEPDAQEWLVARQQEAALANKDKITESLAAACKAV